MSTASKQCSKCGITYPATEEYFHRKEAGLNNVCKQCVREQARCYRAAHPEKAREADRRWRQTHPEEYRERKRRYRESHIIEGREYNRRWREAHPEEVREQARRWRKANPEREYEKSLRYWRNHPEKKREKQRRYRKAHAEELHERQRGWRKTHSVKRREWKHQRRARALALAATFTAQDWQRALSYFGDCCAVCGRPRGLWHTLSQDHWIPVTKGGAYTPDTIVPLCHGESGCNNVKGNKMPHDWLIERLGKRKANQIEKRIEAYFATTKELEGIL